MNFYRGKLCTTAKLNDFMNDIFRCCVCLIIGLLAVCSAKSQEPVYLQYGVSSGLPSNLIYCALQDHNGMMWFGTDKGLACYDGARFHTYNMQDGLPDPEVLAIFEDSRHRLWLSCFRNKPCYYLNGHFYTHKDDPMLDKIVFKTGSFDIWEDEAKRVWMGALSNELYCIAGDSLHFFYMDNAITRIKSIHQRLYAFCMAFMMAKTEHGWSRTDSLVRYWLTEPNHDYINEQVKGDTILFSMNNNLVLLKYQNDQFHLIQQRTGLTGRSYLDHFNRFWVCTSNTGAICFDNPNSLLNNPVQYLKPVKVNKMLEDQQGTRWFCTFDQGLIALPQHYAVQYSAPEWLRSNNITALAGDSESGIFAGDDQGRLYEIQGNKVKTTEFGSLDGYNRVRKIIASPGGAVWIAMDEALVYKKGSVEKRVKGNGNPKIILLQGDKLWLGASKSVGWVDTKTLQYREVEKRRFTAMCGDSDGYVWAGGIDGLSSNLDNFKSNRANQFPILKSRIVALETAGSGAIWVVTPETGLLKAAVQGGQIHSVQQINSALPHPIQSIQSVFQENGTQGKIWLATNSGVYGIDPQFNITHFDTHSGLSDNDVSAVYVENDTLWATTVKGINKITVRSNQPHFDFPTYITGLHYHSGNMNIDSSYLGQLQNSKRCVLPSNASLVELDLTALDLSSDRNFRFKCIKSEHLLPFFYWTPKNLVNALQKVQDITWISSATLSFGVKLPAGTYHIRVLGYNTRDEPSAKEGYIELIMLPYWYETLWFWLFCWTSLGFAIFRIYKTRIAFRELNAAASELQLQALRAQMNPHFVGNSINAIQQFFYPPDPEGASEYISLFNRLLRQTMHFSEQNFIPFREELAYDEDYLRMIQLRFSDRFQFDISGAEAVPNELPFPSMLLQPILENATLHGLSPTGISRLSLAFELKDDFLQCQVQDNGLGIQEMLQRKKLQNSERKSRGLEMLQKKIDTLNRLYDLEMHMHFIDLAEETKEAHGTKVTLQFRLSNLSNPKLKSGWRRS